MRAPDPLTEGRRSGVARAERAHRLADNLRAEIDNAVVYEAMAEAEAERDPSLSSVFGRLAQVERAHAEHWAAELRRLGAEVPVGKPRRRARVLARLARRFGSAFVLPTLAASEEANQHVYDLQPEAPEAMRGEERAHARLLADLSGAPRGGLSGSALARLEGRHRAIGGNALRAAVLGANDGLVSNLSLVMGVAGAGVASGTVLLTGIAGLLAGAFSMAMGEWISVQSSRELHERQLLIEQDELAAFPEAEQEELSLLYQAKGLSRAQADELAARLMADPAAALDTMAREELGIDPGELGGSPWTAAFSSFFPFVVGAVVPIVPLAIADGTTAVVASLAASAVALYAIGAAITLLTGRSVVRSGMRQVLFGLAAAAVTYGVGSAVGVAVSG